MIGLSKSRGALSMENQKMPEYETIRAAVAGEKWAVEKVVDCYKEMCIRDRMKYERG